MPALLDASAVELILRRLFPPGSNEPVSAETMLPNSIRSGPDSGGEAGC